MGLEMSECDRRTERNIPCDGDRRMNRKELEGIISRTAIGTGETNCMSRKQFNQYLIKHYGAEMKVVLKEFWSKRYLTVNGYKEVALTGRWADYQNSLNCIEKSGDEKVNV